MFTIKERQGRNLNLEKVLALDISTKTGYSVFRSSTKEFHLEAYGQIDKINQPDEPYPISYVSWAYLCFEAIEKLIEDYQPDVLIIEEVTKSKNAMSQKILDYEHFLIAKFIKDTDIKNVYFQTGTWRSEVDAKMSEQEKKRNKEVIKYKKKYNTKLARDIKSNRVIGKVTKKHISIRRVNELFGIKLKLGQNDTSDAILLGYAYCLQRLRGLYE